jgi:hypothetical protein
MEREQIIQWAREVGFDVLLPAEHTFGRGGVYTSSDDEISEQLEAFAKKVRDDYSNKHAQLWLKRIDEAVKAEREACAKVCELGVDTEHPTVKGHIMKNFGSSTCLAEAIRARGNT